MKAITLYQPFAGLIALGLKKNETRGWKTNYRGPLLIHAAKRPMFDFQWMHVNGILTLHKSRFKIQSLPLGALVCKANLIDCQQIGDDNCPDEYSLEYQFGNYDHGRYMWMLDGIEPINPIPYKGQQRFFNVPDSIIPQEIISKNAMEG